MISKVFSKGLRGSVAVIKYFVAKMLLIWTEIGFLLIIRELINGFSEFKWHIFRFDRNDT